MVKIIKRGISYRERVYRVECPHCDTIFEFEEREAGIDNSMTIYTDERISLVIECPACELPVYTDRK